MKRKVKKMKQSRSPCQQGMKGYQPFAMSATTLVINTQSIYYKNQLREEMAYGPGRRPL